MKFQSIIQTLTGLIFVLNMNSQNMTIAPGGNLTSSDGAEITIKGNLEVNSLGSFVLDNTTLKVEGSSSGNIKYIKTLANSNWLDISSPVKGQNIKNFADAEPLDSGQNSHSHNKGLASYDNTKNDWKVYQYNSSEWENFTEGEAYLIKLRDITETDDTDTFYDISFTGSIQNTDVELDEINNFIGDNGEINYLQFIGNPFPSAVNIVDEDGASGEGLLVLNSNKLEEITLYFLSSSSGELKYETVNFTSGAKIMTPTEGFFAHTKDVFTIPRSLTNHQQRYSNDRSRKNTKESIFLRITDNATGSYRKTSIFYMEGATTGNDPGYDSTFFYNGLNYFGIYTHLVSDSIGDDYAIQTLPKNGYEKMIVPIGINAKKREGLNSTEITISAEAINIPSEINIYIEDKEMNTIVLLDENSTYTTMISTDYNSIGRFYLHTNSNTLNLNEPSININNISVYTSSRENLRIVGLQNGQATLRIFNILGKKILDTRFKGNGVNDIKLPQSITSGVYIVQLITSTGKLNKKISIE